MFKVKENKLLMYVDEVNVGHIIYDEQPDHFVGTYVFVDPEQRGKNYANELVDEFVQMAKQNNKKIVPICGVINRLLQANHKNMIY